MDDLFGGSTLECQKLFLAAYLFQLCANKPSSSKRVFARVNVSTLVTSASTRGDWNWWDSEEEFYSY